MPAETRPDGAAPAPFPKSFWTANTTELFERAAYYSMASFVVIYLGRLGMGSYWPSTLNSILWCLIYFLPILSGTIADRFGYRRSLFVACVLLGAGYLCMGSPVWFGGLALAEQGGNSVTVGYGAFLPVVIGILLIGVGGSIVKPTILGTVQKTHAGRATLAFAIFYMVVNIGSIVGRVAAFIVRHKLGNLPVIFAVSTVCAAGAFLVVLFLYRDPERTATELAKPQRSIGRILADMVLVLTNLRFALFLLVSSGFWFVYSQIYNVLPLYVSKVVEHNPAMELYTLANPIVIVTCQLLITRAFGKMKPIRSIVVGTVIIGLAMLVNLVPIYTAGGVRALSAVGLPMGALFTVMTVALIAFGELFTSARTFEYIGALAPKGQEGLFLGYANLPTAIGVLAAGPAGALIFDKVMCHNATTLPDGLLELDPAAATNGWLILMGIGFLSAASMWLYNFWLERSATPAPAARPA